MILFQKITSLIHFIGCNCLFFLENLLRSSKKLGSIKALHSSKGSSFLIAFHNSAEVQSFWWQTLHLKNAHKRSQVDKYGDLGGHGISLFLETYNDPQSMIIENHLVGNKHVHFCVVFSMWVEFQHWLLTVSPFSSPKHMGRDDFNRDNRTPHSNAAWMKRFSVNHAMILPWPGNAGQRGSRYKKWVHDQVNNILQDLYEARGDKKLNTKCKPDIQLLCFNYFPPCFQIR